MARQKKVVPVIKERKKRVKQKDGMPFIWEHVELTPDHVMSHMTRRAKVLGGWLVQTFIDKLNCSPVSTVTFIEDPKHKWAVQKPELPPTPSAPSKSVPAEEDKKAA